MSIKYYGIEEALDRVHELDKNNQEIIFKLCINWVIDDETYDKYDYVIIDTVYPEMSEELVKYKNDEKFLLICHTKDNVYDDWENVYYLTSMGKRYIIPCYFPFYDKTKRKKNLYIVQGSLQEKRRNYKSLVNIFEKYKDKDFTIRIIGKGNKLPSCLDKYMDKIDFRNNLNFHEYHKMFNDVTYILPLLDETFEHKYFTGKHSSSISYGIGFGLNFIGHLRLKKIYGDIEGYFYDNIDEFVDVFGKSFVAADSFDISSSVYMNIKTNKDAYLFGEEITFTDNDNIDIDSIIVRVTIEEIDDGDDLEEEEE